MAEMDPIRRKNQTILKGLPGVIEAIDEIIKDASEKKIDTEDARIGLGQVITELKEMEASEELIRLARQSGNLLIEERQRLQDQNLVLARSLRACLKSTNTLARNVHDLGEILDRRVPNHAEKMGDLFGGLLGK